MKKTRVVITGMGIVAPNATRLSQFEQAIKAGKSGIEFHQQLKDLKFSFDAKNMFNPGKIINPYAINENLRYKPERKEPISESFLNFRREGNLLGAAENCNGSGDCRKN